jgi:hypothetical protein
MKSWARTVTGCVEKYTWRWNWSNALSRRSRLIAGTP